MKTEDATIRNLMPAIIRLQHIDVGFLIETDNPAEAKHPMNKPIEGLITFATSDPRIAVKATPTTIPQNTPMTLSLVEKFSDFTVFYPTNV